MNHRVFPPVRPVSGLASSDATLTRAQYGVQQPVCISQYTLTANIDPIFSLFRQRHLNDIQMASNRFHLFMLHEPLMAYVHVITAGRQRFDLNGEAVKM